MDDSLNYLNELTWTYRASRVLQTAVELNLFTQLDQAAQTCPELAQSCGAKPDMLDKLLIAACAMGLLHKEGDRYANTDAAHRYLTAGQPQYQGDIIQHAAGVWQFWNDLPQTIRTEPAAPDPARSHRNFILGMHNITLGGRGQLFLDHIDLAGRYRLFDVGGGPGTYSILACRKYPRLTATVFDLPETIQITREIIRQENLQDRISLLQGSWETSDFGSGNDAVLLSNIMHGPASQTEMKLAKTFASLTPGGMVIIQEFLLNDSKTGPLIPALFNMMVGAWPESELISLIQNAGFSQTTIAARNESIGGVWITALKP